MFSDREKEKPRGFFFAEITKLSLKKQSLKEDLI